MLLPRWLYLEYNRSLCLQVYEDFTVEIFRMALKTIAANDFHTGSVIKAVA